VTRPTRGVVDVEGASPGRDGVRRLIGFAGHRTFLYGALTAEENLRFYADLYEIPAGDVDAALERFALTSVRHRRAGELSRGLVQRLNLARALLHAPRVVLLDEPLTGLDASTTDALAATIARLRGDGRTVVLATHEWETARNLADEAAVLVGGRLVLRTMAGTLARSDLPALYARTDPP
jgi:ABC-2 type transport system ATP-binding protein